MYVNRLDMSLSLSLVFFFVCMCVQGNDQGVTNLGRHHDDLFFSRMCVCVCL